MCSWFVDWVYCHFCTITVDYNRSHIELLLNDVCLENASLISDWSLLRPWSLYSTWIHESNTFYNFHAARIEDNTLNSSSVVVLVATGILVTCYLVTILSLLYVVTGEHDFRAFAQPRTSGSGSTILAFSRHVTIQIMDPAYKLIRMGQNHILF
jgi:hypothetical protein